ncbi:3'-5' exonuclease [Ferrimonas aestuarii]|nr:3'-5' exonuclease [Ferrimonas aestuarii]
MLKPVYFDTETTGLGSDAEIIQIGVVGADGTVLMDTLVQCQGEIPESATAVHGITKADLVGAPTWPEVHEQLMAHFDGALVKIYNASYDRRLLQQTAERYELEVPQLATQCIMRRYADLYFDGQWMSLVNACGYERIDVSDIKAHDAAGDCEMTRRLDAIMSADELRRQARAEYRDRLLAQKMALVPGDISGYPDFRQVSRPLGFKTLSQLRKRDLDNYEFAGRCCDTYGNPGYLFKPKDQ